MTAGSSMLAMILNTPAAGFRGFDVDVEDPFQALRRGSWRRDAPRVSCAPGRRPRYAIM